MSDICVQFVSEEKKKKNSHRNVGQSAQKVVENARWLPLTNESERGQVVKRANQGGELLKGVELW